MWGAAGLRSVTPEGVTLTGFSHDTGAIIIRKDENDLRRKAKEVMELIRENLDQLDLSLRRRMQSCLLAEGRYRNYRQRISKSKREI